MIASVLVASCTAVPDASVALDMPGYNASGLSAPVGATAPDQLAAAPTDGAVATPVMMNEESDTELPAQVAYLPVANPAAAIPDVSASQPSETAPAVPGQAATDSAPVAAVADNEVADAPVPTARPGSTAGQLADAQTDTPVPDAAASEQEQMIATAADAPVSQPEQPKRKTLLAFFGTSRASAAPFTRDQQAKPLFQARDKPVIADIANEQPKPVLQIATAAPPAKPVVMASLGDDGALPGVRQTALFEIKRKSGLNDDSDVDLHEDEDGGSVQLASAGGMARLAPNGLLKQTDTVDVACLKPSLVRVLKTIEQHYGRPIVVTSGYRNPSHNRRARGAKNSLHMFCAAADVQVAGVAKWELANYMRSMPGRGGVGTYCNTESVHVDVGPERDWNWRCRRRK